MVRWLIGSFLVLFFISHGEEDYGREIFIKHCSSCHIERLNMYTNVESLKAPPFDSVVRQAKYYFRDEEKLAEYLSDYLKNPSQEKSVCKPCIMRWGLMPPQNLSDEEIKSLSKWIFRNFR